ncbi:MAG: hypothetical protein PHP50_01120 [Lachnospiraceae bacterium]|nr:hypothetical protein [Lachnospiraceae bacterium]
MNKMTNRMTEREWDQKLFSMAGKETIELSEEFQNRITRVLNGLPEKKENSLPDRKSDGKRGKLTWKKALILAAALTLLLSMTVSAAVYLVKARMEAMNHEKLEEYYVDAAKSFVGYDNKNRPYTDAEEKRMAELRMVYEAEGRFPKGELTLLEDYQDYAGKGVAFVAKTSTFFFPEAEMSDEELLQIIDFYAKRDYSVTKLGSQIAAGTYVLEESLANDSSDSQDETENAANKPTGAENETAKQDILQNRTLYQEIPYTGDVELYSMTAGANCIYLCGWNGIQKMEFGSSTSEPFYTDFPMEDTRVVCMTEGTDGMLYAAAVYYWNTEQMKCEIWQINQAGKLENSFSIKQFAKDGYLIVRRMVMDDKGYLYLRTTSDSCLVLDKEGKLISRPDLETYETTMLSALGQGKDGRVYTVLLDKETGNNTGINTGIAAINPETGALEDVQTEIFGEEAVIPFDLLMPGTDTDFVLWGYSGLYTYNNEDEKAVQVIAPYEATFQWEGAKYAQLPGGRILFAMATNVTEVKGKTQFQTQYRWKPECTTFYYVPVK